MVWFDVQGHNSRIEGDPAAIATFEHAVSRYCKPANIGVRERRPSPTSKEPADDRPAAADRARHRDTWASRTPRAWRSWASRCSAWTPTSEKVARLSQGELPVFEPQLGELVRDGLASGRLAFTASYPDAAAFGDVHFICVGTPQRHDGDGADLSQVHACVAALAPLLTRPCLVAGKSTVPAGTGAAIAAEIARRAPAGESAELCWNPEFLREGHAVDDTLTPDRIVVGVSSPRAEAVMREVYASQLAAGVPFFVTDLATAELAKAAANAFLATKISFINAMAEMCDASRGRRPGAGPACSAPTRGSARPS